jgi:hypothetical protein
MRSVMTIKNVFVNKFGYVCYYNYFIKTEMAVAYI